MYDFGNKFRDFLTLKRGKKANFKILLNKTSGNKQTSVTNYLYLFSKWFDSFVYIWNVTMAGVKIINKHLDGPKILVTMDE